MTTIGILGAGQLAKMLAIAAVSLGFKTITYDADENACSQMVSPFVHGDFLDETKLTLFAKQVDIITYETENIPTHTLQFLQTLKPILPNKSAIEVASDRIKEKSFIRSINFATTDFFPIHSLIDLQLVSEQEELPFILKTTRFGYDGKGQYLAETKADVLLGWQALSEHAPLILERKVEFKREFSIIAVRSIDGEMAFYPVTNNEHVQGILRFSKPIQDNHIQHKAELIARACAEKLNYVGVLTIELFETQKGLLVNEIAPRVHNSGHWTIEGAYTSQFENHIRAITGLPLGDCRLRSPSAMLNLISKLPDKQAVLTIPGTHWHEYGKTAKAGRKLGHVTITAENNQSLLISVRQLQELVFA